MFSGKSVMQNNSLLSAFVALFAAFMCVFGFITLPGPAGIPVVLQNIMAIFAGTLLGGVQGAASVGLFLTAGALGLPVFSMGRGGMAHLLSPTGGFLLGYFFAAFFAGIYLGKPKNQEKTSLGKIIFAYVVGLLIIYGIGLFQFLKVKNLPLYPQEVFLVIQTCIIPFLPADIVKIVLFVPLTYKLRDVLPRYLSFDVKDENVLHE